MVIPARQHLARHDAFLSVADNSHIQRASPNRTKPMQHGIGNPIRAISERTPTKKREKHFGIPGRAEGLCSHPQRDFIGCFKNQARDRRS